MKIASRLFAALIFAGALFVGGISTSEAANYGPGAQIGLEISHHHGPCGPRGGGWGPRGGWGHGC